MKKLIYLISAAVILLTACTKEETKQETPVAETPCGNGDNFCFTMDGTTYSGTARLLTPPGRYRVYWEDTGTPFQQVELDLYLAEKGTYACNQTDTANVVKFEYAKAGSPPINKHIINGTAEITLYDPTGAGVSGTFSGTTETGQVSSGTFYQVK